MPVRIRWTLAGIAAVAVLVAGGAWYAFGRGTPATAGPTVGRSGGTLADAHRGVAVEVAPGGATTGTTVTFLDPTRPLPESPLSALFDVLIPPVDIRPAGGTITNANVVFTVDPAAISAGRTIRNAGIEVFNDALGTRIPIPTEVRGTDKLVAHAPHFSIFRTILTSCPRLKAGDSHG